MVTGWAGLEHMLPENQAPPMSCQTITIPSIDNGSQFQENTEPTYRVSPGSRGLWVKPSQTEREEEESILSQEPRSSPLAGLQERLGIRYKATSGPASTLPHLSERPPMLFLAPATLCTCGNVSIREGRTRGLTGVLCISGPALAWLTHNACAC